MKKISLLCCSMICAMNVFALDIIKDTKPVSKIYVDPVDLADDGAKNLLQPALEDLNYHFEKMSGTSLEVVKTASPKEITNPAIVLGSLAAKAGASPEKTKWQEGYRILVNDHQALLAGETPRATAYAIYALLGQLGCDWVMPGPLGEIIPEQKTVRLTKQDISSSPDFGVRRFWYRGGPNIVTKENTQEYKQWTRRQRLGSAKEFQDDREGHIWDQLIRKYKDQFDADPDMLALVRQADGTLVRKGPQFESTNPKVVKLVAEDIRKIFEEKKWPKDKKVTLGIGPADGGGYSLSADSITASSGRTDPVLGGADVSDLVVKLGNDVLDIVGDEFPNLSLGYYIYSVHADYPMLHKPNPRIYPIFAPISYSRLHSTEDPHSKTRAYYHSILDQWVQLGKEQGNQYSVYEYNWNLADNMLPYTRLKMLSEDIAMYHRMGFFGVILESTKAWAINGPADYVAAHLVWDASQDWKKIFHDYCEKSFGPAAPALESYYLRLADIQSKAGQEAGSYYAAPLIFDEAYMQAAQTDVDKALAQKLTDAQRLRVEAAVYPFSTLKDYLAWNRAMSDYDFAKASEKYDAILQGWQAMLDKNEQFVAREVPGYMRGLMEASTKQALKYASAPYEIVFKFPDALPTALDPAKVGDRLNLAGTEINDSGWLKTQTFGSTWDAQGLGFYREGAVWYRVHFDVPKNLEGKALGLFVGGFEDEVRVWINGKALGSSGVKFANPAVFDLTDGILYGQENVIAIQVIRNSNLNENLLGGLFRPSFVFVGPRVEVADKKGEPEYRILPGGEKELIKK